MKWKTISLGSLTKIKTGKLDANACHENGLYPFFTCSNTPLKINDYAYDTECVLVAGNGDLNVKYYNGKFNAYQRTYIIEPKNDLLICRYLYYFLSKYVEKLRFQSIGGVIKYIKLGYLTDAIIPLPPIDTQRRIVYVLDKADELRRKRKESIAKLDELLHATFIDMFGDPVVNPKGLKTDALNNYLINIDSGWSPKCLNVQTEPNKSGVLKLSSVTGGNYNYLENKMLPSNLIFKPSIEVKNNDLLFTRKNTKELVGACAYVWNTPPLLMMPDTIFRLVLNDSLNKIFVWRLFNTVSFRNIITRMAEGSAGSMPNISKKKLNNLSLPVPPKELQDKFAEIIKSIYTQKKQLEKSLSEFDDLFNSLLQRAFKGELSFNEDYFKDMDK